MTGKNNTSIDRTTLTATINHNISSPDPNYHEITTPSVAVTLLDDDRGARLLVPPITTTKTISVGGVGELDSDDHKTAH